MRNSEKQRKSRRVKRETIRHALVSTHCEFVADSYISTTEKYWILKRRARMLRFALVHADLSIFRQFFSCSVISVSVSIVGKFRTSPASRICFSRGYLLFSIPLYIGDYGRGRPNFTVKLGEKKRMWQTMGERRRIITSPPPSPLPRCVESFPRLRRGGVHSSPSRRDDLFGISLFPKLG